MKIRLVFTLCSVLFLRNQVLAEEDNGIRRGQFPFMAFLYYSDESVTESMDARFLRGAVLVKSDWLITSSVGPAMINDLPYGFPRKTLLARLGAVSIDNKFTINEDEDEQEREVIQIVRPHNQSATQWWRTDITLVKTLMPFNITSAAGLATLPTWHGSNVVNYTNCFILVYSKRSANQSEERILMQMFVNMLPSNSNYCGKHFYEESMICANDDEENKNIASDPKFCQGNSGGPLICDSKVTGIQTYIENNCQQPHLYQHLKAWSKFITCGIENKCYEEQCANMCTVTNKDDPTKTDMITKVTKNHAVADNSLNLTEETTMPSSTVELVHHEDVFFSSPSITPTILLLTEETSPSTHANSAETKTTEILEEKSWPKEKNPQRDNAVEEEEQKIERKTSVEARVEKKGHGAANRNMCFLQSFFSISILACLM